MDGSGTKDTAAMTQGFPGFGAPQQQFAPPAQPQFTQPPAPAQQFAPPQGGGFFQTQDPHIQVQQGNAPHLVNQNAPQQQQQTDTAGFWGGAAAISFDDRKGYVKGTPR